MREFQIAVFPGDGIGREVMTPCLALLDTVVERVGDLALHFQTFEAGAELYRDTGIALPEDAVAAARSADAILLGAMGLPAVRYPDGTEVAPQLDFRERFELYAGVRPIRVLAGVPTPLADPRARKIDCASPPKDCSPPGSSRAAKATPCSIPCGSAGRCASACSRLRSIWRGGGNGPAGAAT